MIVFTYFCKKKHINDNIEVSQSGDLWGLGNNGVERRAEAKLFWYNIVYNCDFCTMYILVLKKSLIQNGRKKQTLALKT